MFIDKKKIINCFNKSANTYDTVAEVQAYVAQQLASRFSEMKAHTILEVGCGTGLLSRYLIKLFPQARLLLIDIAQEMVAKCQHSFVNDKRVRTICVDGEQFSTLDNFDLIVSNMTLHWFSHIQQSLSRMTTHLVPGGQLFFSMLGENSFKEWRAVCTELDIPQGTPHFYSADFMQKVLPGSQIQVEVVQHSYASVSAFLNSLKHLGAMATRPGYVPVSSGKLRHAMRRFTNEFTITYEIIYGHYIKS